MIRRGLITLGLGLLVMLACEVLLLGDVRLSGRGAIHSQAEFVQLRRMFHPGTRVEKVCRWVAVNMTPLAWAGYLLFLEGLLTVQTGRSPIRRRPHHFALLCLASIPIWCVFDWVNFYSIQAWRYIGMPAHFGQKLLGYFLAFGTIVPGMLLSGQFLLDAGVFHWARVGGFELKGRKSAILGGSFVAGAAMFLWPLVHHDPVTNLTLWCSLVFLLDPVNYWLGRPSMFRDWFNGNFARTLGAFAGGLICGLLWEFWNYWALTKWTYHLPFLGRWEHYRYFEMPLPGLLGFLPFAMECWVLWQTLRIFLDGLAEPLADDGTLI